ncbi:efflux RND transporter periplasmic adaptor subunit [Xanthomonas translucens]|uniref:Hemolysin D n=2 Tax=Xanthomonas campestris pv. translucens TaxID=343 RepID=A0A109HNX4_XANCT|nr:efflux RND transporter periplasmic adaptor subunit [Xanthomonas translucens]KWV15778.1 hemolysin D [Xanthomonas translucens]QSQ34759.1 efflux RND transporter periplasmic adaptor subunit [Xanthomonas translucens pv. translucens]
MSAPFVQRSRRTLSLLLCLALVTLAGCKGERTAPPAQARTVGVLTLQPQSVPLSAELAGRTAASEESEVRPQVGGILRKRLFEEGAMVRAGQPLFQIEPVLYQAAANEAQANLATAEATLATAKLRAERYRELGKTRLAAQQDVDDAQATYKEALAGRDANRAALDTARTQLRFATVEAPISGRVGRARVTPGALVTASQADAIAKIQQLDPMNVDITQSGSQFLALRRAIAAGGVQPATADVRLKLSDGSDYPLPGTLQFADIDVEETTGSVTLRARFPNPDAQLLPGMYVRAIVGQGIRQQALLVPQAAVDRTPRGDAQAWVVGADNIVRQRQFTTLRAVGDRWLVGDGLKPGERVVVEGRQGLSDGAKVTVKPAAAAAGKG